MSADVATVTGPIDAEDLGTTLIHEHLIFRDEAVLAQWPHAGTGKESEPPKQVSEDGAFEPALESARAVLERGAKTIAEPTGMFGGRDVRFSRRVAEETGLQVVPCTGIYTYDYLRRTSCSATRTRWRTSSSTTSRRGSRAPTSRR